jgi:hypothetical protein
VCSRRRQLAENGAFVSMTLLPIMAVALAGFMAIGAALPVFPLHVSHDRGFGSVIVGLVTGAQLAASLFSRVCSGSSGLQMPLPNEVCYLDARLRNSSRRSGGPGRFCGCRRECAACRRHLMCEAKGLALVERAKNDPPEPAIAFRGKLE